MPTPKTNAPKPHAKPCTAPEKSKPCARLCLTVQFACTDAGLPTRAQLRRWLTLTCERDATVVVRFVDAPEGRALNHHYRGKDRATNVLSFVYEQHPEIIGDIVLCVPVARDEAQRAGKSMLAHVAHLAVHGMLHLHGYDHEQGEEDALRMENRERHILARLRFDDPYA
jgi:probable rRNA maturation factor